MKKFLLGLSCGVIITGSTVVYASDSIQALLFPAKVTFHLNGQTKELAGDQTSILNYNNRTYIPLRAFSESMGSTVNYSDKSGPQVDVYFGSEPQPDTEPATDPTIKEIKCDWAFHQYDETGTRIYGSPINPYLSVDKDEYTTGESVMVEMRMTNIDDQTVSFEKPNSFEVQIMDMSRQVIWQGKTSALTSIPLPQAGSMQTQFQWDQKDSSGKQVPPGKYTITIATPSSFKYTMNGKEQIQTIKQQSMGYSGYFIIK